MMTARRKMFLGGLGGLAVAAALALAPSTFAPRPVLADEPKEADPDLEEARREVKMLDELYKTAVVSITERYQRGQPAIMVAMDIFKAMESGRYHSARLVDATESPLGVDNSPKTDFETRAAEAMRAGKTYMDEVVGQGDDRRLLAATVVPAVHARCAQCHGVEKGDLLGFIRYEIPIR